jgi:SAM-dependent methyltransferase
LRDIDDKAIAVAAEVRFRSEYHYAHFEYLRSAKVIRALERAGVRLAGRILDAGCGSGGTVLSLAEEASSAVGLDLDARFRDSGTRLAQEHGQHNVAFVQGDGTRLPFREASFDLVFSHSVIEHVESASDYLRECRRVLRPRGVLYLSTAPYLSFAGAHLPRLKWPIPVHILLGRRLAFRLFCWLGRHAPALLKEAKEANTFVSLADAGGNKHDDLLQLVTVRRLSRWLAESGLERVSEERSVTGFFRRLVPEPLRRLLERWPLAQDMMTSQIQCILRRP